MAKKKIGIYTQLESTPNYKVEDLYLIVDKEGIVFSVKNKVKHEFVAFEHFVNTAENTGWHQLVAYLQNNSKLIQNVFGNIHFVWNDPKFIVTKKMTQADSVIYQQELSLVHGANNDEEIYVTPYDESLVILFSVPDALSTLISRSFPTGKWHHYIEYVMTAEANNDALVYLFENHFVLRLVKNGQTQLVNYCPMAGNDQNAYSILNACKQAGIVLDQTQLKVWGYQKEQHDFIEKIASVFGTFNNITAPDQKQISSTYFIF